MKPLFQYYVKTILPEKLFPLKEIAENYWWCWRNDAKKLFHEIDKDLFVECNHNPKLFLSKLTDSKINNILSNDNFMKKMKLVHKEFKKYLTDTSWYGKNKSVETSIAYFSPEFGINESFPNYSGGLGVLSGDHLKSASDLGLPLVGVGLLYQEGYFRQRLSHHGWQTEIYKYNDFFDLPLELVEKDGQEVHIPLDLPDDRVLTRVWKLKIGRVTLILLDTNIDQNKHKHHREITNRLYGGDRETRIQQEIVLGIGGMRALEALDILPSVVHINEGHAAFALLERTKQYMQKYQMNFKTASNIVKLSSVFTTHTPVPAGNETFEINRLDRYFYNYIGELGLTRDEFLKLGRIEGHEETKFSMTVLGLKLTAYANGVSKLHGEVSREMWQGLWREFPEQEIGIGHITNGIHSETWLASEFEALYNKYLKKDWQKSIDDEKLWEKVYSIPDSDIWEAKKRRRARLLDFAREHLSKNTNSYLNTFQLREIDSFLDEDTLTIGFARRFATYKRANLLFSDMDRLKKIVENAERPIQILIAGKAHPHDVLGKEVIKDIIEKVKNHGLEKRIVFLEDYDMVIGRLLVKGCDIWLNNPIRPMEASGTSGMKAALNGGLNLSILDGWWEEAYDGLNGFSFGSDNKYNSDEERNKVESEELYDILEFEVTKIFYQQDEEGVHSEWIRRMKDAIKTIAPYFSTHRMVKEYAEKYYLKAAKKFAQLKDSDFSSVNQLQVWKEQVSHNWEQVNLFNCELSPFENIIKGDKIKIKANVYLADLNPDQIKCEAYYGHWSHKGTIENGNAFELELISFENKVAVFEGEIHADYSGMQGLTCRVSPFHELIDNHSVTRFIKWA